MPNRRSIRLNTALIEAAENQCKTHHRSTANQIEYWASIGRRLAPILSTEELAAIERGLVRISIELEHSDTVNLDLVLAEIAQHQGQPFISMEDKPATFYFESSSTPGCIDRIDMDGGRVTGKMINGIFTPNELAPPTFIGSKIVSDHTKSNK